jgi:RHS repeat-associated protein
LLTDAAGAKLQTYTYDVWGEPSGFDASGNPIAARTFESRFLFTASEYDVETALYHYRARTYSPHLVRFAHFDPIDFAAGDTNLLRYVSNQKSEGGRGRMLAHSLAGCRTCKSPA